MSYRPFQKLKEAPPDPILGLTETFRKDANPKKVNLCIGVFQDETGHNPVLKSVKQAERMVLEQERTKDYLNMAGDEAYGQGVRALIFGDKSPRVSDGRASTLHTPGGTGALRVGADFLHTHYADATLWLSDPTWPNHKGIFESAGMKVKSYPYYEAKTNGLNLQGLLKTLEEIPEGDVVLLHGCCHNPTGVDPTPQQWQQILEVFRRRPIIPFLDFAYQGFGRGLEEDAYAVRLFAEAGLELLVASSFSKNLGLYRERVGALTLISGEVETAKRLMSQVKLNVRTNYSNPPSHGGKVVEIILGDPTLRLLWQEEVAQMRSRIQGMRQSFVENLKKRGVTRNFEFLMQQNGMFSFSGIGKEDVLRLRGEYGIYMTDNGRINVAGMTPGNMGYLCDSIAAVLKG